VKSSAILGADGSMSGQWRQPCCGFLGSPRDGTRQTAPQGHPIAELRTKLRLEASEDKEASHVVE
jgi:hypothetical protein